MGYACYLMLKVKIYFFSLTIMLLICSVCAILLVFLLEIEDRLKQEPQTENADDGRLSVMVSAFIRKIPFAQRINLSAIYLFFCGAFLYLGSPSPYPITFTKSHLVFRATILVLPLLVWLFSGHKLTRKLRIIEIMLLLMMGVLAYFLSQYARTFLLPNHWTFGWVTFTFLIMNTIFIKNRQNARDDLIALQNYTFKRIVFSDKNKSGKHTVSVSFCESSLQTSNQADTDVKKQKKKEGGR